MFRTRQRRGYILLMTLILLAIAGAAMAGMVQRSLGRAVESIEAQEQLQRRWSGLSCQAVILHRAERLLQQHEQETGKPSAGLYVQLEMGQYRVLLILSDEQAKANINLLYRLHGRAQLEQSLRPLLRDAHADLRLRLRPSTGGTTIGKEPMFDSLGQVFAESAPEQLLTANAGKLESIALTCWGNGRLRLHRAPREVIDEVCRPLLAPWELERLLAARNDAPAMPMDRMLGMLQLNSDKLSQVQARLTERSSCHSLWTIVVTPARSWYRLDVQTVDDRNQFQVQTFSW